MGTLSVFMRTVIKPNFLPDLIPCLVLLTSACLVCRAGGGGGEWNEILNSLVGSRLDHTPASQTITYDPKSLPDDEPVETHKITMSSEEIIRTENYPVETHMVTTPDLFRLTIFRIPKPGGVPVYILHGVLCSSRDWLVQRGKNSLPFQLFDAGFDIWLGNMRGTTYSSTHLNYTRKDPRYWQYTADDIIKYDNPTVIDYILSQVRGTGQEKLIWIGWSLGSFSFYGTMATRPEYNDKILHMVALAPFISLQHMTSPVKLFGYFTRILPLETILGSSPVPLEKVMALLSPHVVPSVCTNRALGHSQQLRDIGIAACDAFLTSLVGPNYNETSKAALSVALSETPNTYSVRLVSQLLTGVTHPDFRRYDYGSSRTNRRFYGQEIPPSYPIQRVTAPIILYSGNCDSIVETRDTDILAASLPCPPRRRYVNCFDHTDFVFGRHAPQLYAHIVDDLLTVLKEPGNYQSQCNSV